MLDYIAVRYKCLPHTLLDIDLEDLQIDLTCAEVGNRLDLDAIKKLRLKKK